MPSFMRRRAMPRGGRENLVRIGLVPDVPDDAVLGRIEHVVQRDGQLDRARLDERWPPVLETDSST